MKKKFTLKRLANCSLFIAAIFYLAGCKKNVDENALHASQSSQATEQNHFRRGVFIINEGLSDQTRGSINWKQEDLSTPVLDQNLYTQQNPGKQLGGITAYGTVWNGKLYLVSKETTPLVVTDAITLKETGRLNYLLGFGRAFVGLTPDLGLVSTDNGVYKLNLNPLSLGASIDGVTGLTGAMLQAGNYIFILSYNRGMVVLDKNTFSIVKTIGGPNNGVTQTPDGNVYTAGDSILYKINSASLLVTKIKLPFTIRNPWYYEWNAGSIIASTRQNAVYLEEDEFYLGGVNHIYRYIVGNPSTLSAPIAALPAGYNFWGTPCFTATGALVVSIAQGLGTIYQQNALEYFDGVGNKMGLFPYKANGYPAILIPVFN